MKRNNENSQQQIPYSVMVPDLRLCTIRPMNDGDRRFVFEILSPNRFVEFTGSNKIFVCVRLVRIFCKLIHKINVINGLIRCN